MDNIDMEKIFTAHGGGGRTRRQVRPPAPRPTFADERDAFAHWVDD